MKKNALMIMVFSLLITCALYVFLSQIVAGYQYLNTPPYGGENDYISVIIQKHRPITANEINLLRKELLAITQTYPDLTILMHREGDRTLYLHDTLQSYRDYDVLDGEYFLSRDFVSVRFPVMVQENTSIFQLIHDGVTFINGKPRPVQAIYTEDYPLASKYGQYDSISTLLSATDWRGTYYFEHADSSVIDPFLSLFHNYGYETTYLEHKYSFRDWMKELFREPTIISMCLGILFIYFAYFVTYYLLFSRRYREFVIHCYYGATKMRLLTKIASSILPYIGLGALLGSILGAILYLVAGEISYIVVFVGSFVLHLLISGILITIAFYRQQLWKIQWGVVV